MRRVALSMPLVALVAVLAAACVSVQFGALPRVDNLAKLQVGASRPSDILLALGEPRGRGVARLVGWAEPRTIWFYEHTRAEGSQVELTILLVFLKENRYDGHLWFSSAQILQKQE